MQIFIGTPRVIAPVLRKFAVSQLRSGGFDAKANGTAMQSIAYRALKDSGGRVPKCVLSNIV